MKSKYSGAGEEGFSGGESQATTLEEMVVEYLVIQKTSRKYTLRRHLKDYRDCKTFDSAMKSAVFGEDLMSDPPKRHGHQRRIQNASMQEAFDRLRDQKRKIKASRSFSEVFAIVEQCCRPIPGLGELYIYDASLRISAHLGFLPELVYLHAGARTGAKLLGVDVRKSVKSHKEFPRPLWKLKPHEIEDFLCSYKDSFASLDG